MSSDRVRRILVAGVGNAWLRDDGFGGEVARRLEQREMPEGVAVMDAGTGGLDLAYEVMRGYDALVILDVSRQGGEPGTLYVMEPDEQSVQGSIEDGEMINPHAMDPQTMLRFVRSAGAWPGKVVVIACEPADVEEMGWGLSDQVKDAVQRAVDLVAETIDELGQSAGESALREIPGGFLSGADERRPAQQIGQVPAGFARDGLPGPTET